MPSPYELRTRWLEWHERWPVAELESLKRQIDCVKREIARREDETLPLYDADQIEEKQQAIDEMYEVLATLERLMPPF